MQGSILIYGGNTDLRHSKITEILQINNLTESSTDVLILQNEEDKKSIGIAQSRELLAFATTKPFENKHKIGIIKHAYKLTTQAQNALLKTLEDRPDYLTIILETRAENELLETVISRCKRIEIVYTSKDALENNEDLNKLLSMTVGERLSYSVDFCKKDREEVIEIFNNWLLEARNIKRYDVVENLLKVVGDLEKTNLNLKLAVEWLMLNLN
ncbi:MAG: hypothetical protein R3B92_00825 [Patescibacteria group bacterium]